MKEVEDGMGFSGLIPSKGECLIEKLQLENKELKETIESYKRVYESFVEAYVKVRDEKRGV